MAKQTGVDPQVKVLAIWHNWFTKPNGDDEATGEQVHKILAGLEPLPPGSRIRLAVDSIPETIKNKDADLVAQFPDWRFTLIEKESKNSAGVDVVNTDSPHGQFMSIQSPDRPGGFHQASRGYAPIFIYEPAVAGPLALEIRAEFANGWSASEMLPWVAGK